MIIKYYIKKKNTAESNLLLKTIILNTHEHGSSSSAKYLLQGFYRRTFNFLFRALNKNSKTHLLMFNYIFKLKKKSKLQKNCYSLSGQDLFVQSLISSTSEKTFYFEVGAGWPIKINNTYLLERYHNWQGISIDFDQKMVDNFNLIRNNKCLLADATKINYKELFLFEKFPLQIDYLSLDIDPAIQTLLVLALIPFEDYEFKVITFEHDSYRNGSLIKNISRILLKKYGYVCVYKNVKAIKFGKYEDWWINPKYISEKKAKIVVDEIKKLKLINLQK